MVRDRVVDQGRGSGPASADGRGDGTISPPGETEGQLAPMDIQPTAQGLRGVFDGLSPDEIEWAVTRADCRSDAEVARRLGLDRHRPIPGHLNKQADPGYDAARMQHLRRVAHQLRRERVLGATLLLERMLLDAIGELAKLVTGKDVPPKVRLDAINTVLDRVLGKSGVKDSPVGTIEAVTDLVNALRKNLPTAEEADRALRDRPTDYVDGEFRDAEPEP